MAEPGRRPIVVVGAGLAGAKTVEALRADGFDGQVVLVGAEPHRPYERPALSKAFLSGTEEREKVFVHPEQWYAEHDVDLRVGTTATAIRPGDHEVVLSTGEALAYDKLTLATGSEPRRLPVPGAELPAVMSLRTLDDSERLKQVLRPGSRAVMIGGGWIGLEVAAAARGLGAEVTVLEGLELPLLRVLGREMAELFAQLHRDHGVDLRCSVSVTGIEPAGSGAAVRLADGDAVAGDVILVGVGIAPRVELAQEAGLSVDNGIVTTAGLRTSDPDVFAVGDVASAFHPVYNRHLRVEHWANAMNQPAVAAASMLGKEAAYERQPYFYSDQYDLGTEYFGYADLAEVDHVVVRGTPEKQDVITFWLRAGQVLAGMHVNRWDDANAVKALVRQGGRPDPVRLADPAVPLEELVEAGS